MNALRGLQDAREGVPDGGPFDLVSIQVSDARYQTAMVAITAMTYLSCFKNIDVQKLSLSLSLSLYIYIYIYIYI